MLDVGQPVRCQARLQRAVAPMIEGGIVDHEHLALRTHDEARKLAVIAVAREHIRYSHARLDAGETQQLGRVVQCVSFHIRGAAARVGDRRVVGVAICMACRAQTQSAKEHRRPRRALERIVSHGRSPQVPARISSNAIKVTRPAADR